MYIGTKSTKTKHREQDSATEFLNQYILPSVESGDRAGKPATEFLNQHASSPAKSGDRE